MVFIISEIYCEPIREDTTSEHSDIKLQLPSLSSPLLEMLIQHLYLYTDDFDRPIPVLGANGSIVG
jgi:hypothetical protein